MCESLFAAAFLQGLLRILMDCWRPCAPPRAVCSSFAWWGATGRRGRELSELVDALPARGLKTLAVANMRVGGALPEVLFEKCAEAEVVMLYQLGLTGGMPASVGKCAKLKALVLKGNELEGCIPDEIGKCVQLEGLN